MINFFRSNREIIIAVLPIFVGLLLAAFALFFKNDIYLWFYHDTIQQVIRETVKSECLIK